MTQLEKGYKNLVLKVVRISFFQQVKYLIEEFCDMLVLVLPDNRSVKNG